MTTQEWNEKYNDEKPVRCGPSMDRWKTFSADELYIIVKTLPYATHFGQKEIENAKRMTAEILAEIDTRYKPKEPNVFVIPGEEKNHA